VKDRIGFLRGEEDGLCIENEVDAKQNDPQKAKKSVETGDVNTT